MFAAVAAGVYSDINEAVKCMGSDIEVEYKPNERYSLVYEALYRKYIELAGFIESY